MAPPLASNELAFAINAPESVVPGHALVLLRRSPSTYFEASPEEKRALWALVDAVQAQLDAELHPDGYEVRFTTGELLPGAPVRAQVHILPQLGVRSRQPPLATGGDQDPLARHLWPLFSGASEIAIVAAFVTETGLAALEKTVFGALRAGARLRVITGDYLAFNQVNALQQLLGWSQLAIDGHSDPAAGASRRLAVRVVETAQADGSERAFHPKAWLFESSSFGVAFVGSSNLSHSALNTGIEWNLRVERAIDPVGYASVRAAVDALWSEAIELTAEWIDAYAERVRQAPRSLPPGDGDLEVLEPPPEPHVFQQEALAALRSAREQGKRRALVVLATGLGKTWLAGFDVARFAESAGRWPRVLFLAHREELLAQAAHMFRRLISAAGQPAEVGWCAGELLQPSAAVVVGSIQKLCRAENLERLAQQRFDYVIVDEVHHADAPTYRRVLERLDPTFLLGLTATPERADDGDILGMFDDFVAYRADLGAGIQSKRLVPFAYHGVRDDIDYAHLPWRNQRFDPAALAAAVQTQRRMERLWSAWQEHAGTRTLVFCCSVEHARFATSWLAERSVRVHAVFAGAGSGDRADSLAKLAAGELDALCVVDMFNEGIDVPAVDRVVMLRPTESPVVFLQQLGRGLRRHPDKERLTVIDFVGNHRLFLDRIRRLLSLVPSPPSLREYLESKAEPVLPDGCSIDLELELKELLQAFLPRGALEVERVYRELVLRRGERPRIGELYRMGYRPSTLRRVHGSWFRFVAGERDLSQDEAGALSAIGEWLDELESSSLPDPSGLIVLDALLDADALFTGLPEDEVARRCQEALARSPELLQTMKGPTEIDVWARGRGWFAMDGERLVPRRLAAPRELHDAVAAMTRELVDYRLQMFRAHSQADGSGAAFSCTVLWNKRDPILKLPRRRVENEVPTGETTARLPDGSVWSFKFAKEFCNVARPAGSDRNRLPDLMRTWFGPAAGRPGTRFEVQFSRSPDGWWVEPLGESPALPARGHIAAYPTLRAAAGAAAGERFEPPEAEIVSLPVDGVTDDLFAVRASGDSMNGGKNAIQDGDWLVMRWARGASFGGVEGRVALLETADAHDTLGYQVKRVVQRDGRWWLQSDNARYPSVEASAETTLIAQLGKTYTPEALAPPVGARLEPAGLNASFGLRREQPIERTGRYEGHLFVVVTERGLFSEPDRLAVTVGDRRPGETAFVLVRSEGDTGSRYCGVGRWLEDEGAWAIPTLDFATWRAFSDRRDCSRRLPDAARARAGEFLDELLRRVGVGASVTHDGKRCRIVERTREGLRIDGGEGGFAARQVTITDLAWVLLAADDVARNGAVLDEPRVNRVRYLEGTPKGSTRWIDTGWAIVLVSG